ncbi:unnamed protein product [Urochloa decumbens]|uniref:DNA-directed RNA polymerase subunit n=1 Tax=Urochloa decumbens TaxID=240449 RepID=A0ABC8XJY4_9POAL
MAFWQARDFLFCGVCGTLLTFDSIRSASCPLCGFKRMAKGVLPPPPFPSNRVLPLVLYMRPVGNIVECIFFPFAEIEGKETRYTVTAEDIRRELKIEPFVTLESSMQEVVVQRPVITKTCPECNHSKAEYYTRQMRSADEGETAFYECTKCQHKFKD